MALFQSKQVAARVPAPTPDDATCALAITTDYVTPVGGLAVGSIIEMGALPDNCIPVDVIVSTGILGASVTLDAGLLSGTFAELNQARTIGSELFASPQVAATAVLLRGTKSLTAVSPVLTSRGWGLKTAGATTAAGVSIRATLYVVPAPVAIEVA
jgi:hypothetical protein